MKSIAKKALLLATTAAVGTSYGAVSESFASRMNQDEVVSYEQGDLFSHPFGGYDLVTADSISYQEPRVAGIYDEEYDDYEFDDYDFEDEEYEYGNGLDEELPHDYYCFTNDEFYSNLVIAKENFDKYYKKGSFSSQMQNNGYNLSNNEIQYLDNAMSCIYQNICNYLSCYDNNDFMSCYYYGTALMDNYYSEFGFDEAYYFLIAKDLPSQYQSTIAYTDNYGAYVLENGEILRLIGTENDPLLSNHYSSTDEYDDAIAKTQWFQKLPSIMKNHYSTVSNTVSDDDVCYIWNDTVVDKICTKEWKNIKEQDSEYYGFDPDKVSVVWSNEYNSYVYVDYDNNAYGTLSYDNSRKVDNILMVQDALSLGEGNVYELDSAIKEMNTKESSKTYTR